jgi:hypothetical protein
VKLSGEFVMLSCEKTNGGALLIHGMHVSSSETLNSCTVERAELQLLLSANIKADGAALLKEWDSTAEVTMALFKAFVQTHVALKGVGAEPPRSLHVAGDICVSNEFYPHGDAPPRMARPGEGQEVDLDWLSEMLNCQVKTYDVAASVSEEGRGVTYRVSSIVYAKAPPFDPVLMRYSNRPAAVNIKMHAPSEARAIYFQGSGGTNSYDQELAVYESLRDELLHGLDFNLPKVYALYKDKRGGSGSKTECFNLVLEDLLTAPAGWVQSTVPPFLEEVQAQLLAVRSMHVKFFDWQDPRFTSPPLSPSGMQFAWSSNQPLVSAAHLAWPAVRRGLLQHLDSDPSLDSDPLLDSGPSLDSAPSCDTLVALFDALTESDGRAGMRLFVEVERMLGTRVPTLVHCDLKAGSIWKGAGGGVLITDWQRVGSGPIGFDVYALLASCNAFLEPGSVETMLRRYHTGLPVEMQARYPYAHLLEDVALIGITSLLGMLPLIARQLSIDDQSGSRDNAKESMLLIGRTVILFDQLGAYAMAAKIAGVVLAVPRPRPVMPESVRLSARKQSSWKYLEEEVDPILDPILRALAREQPRGRQAVRVAIARLAEEALQQLR